MHPLKHILIFCFALTLLSGCGFHLRGHTPIPEELKTLYLTSANPYSPLTKEVHRQLRTRGIHVLTEPKPDVVTLRILQDNVSETINSVSADTKVREYRLAYTMNYQLIDTKGNRLGPSHSVVATRSYTSQLNQTLGSNQERLVLERDMRRDVAQQLLLRLSSRRTLALFNKKT